MKSQLYPYLAFENAKEALDYYKKVFGATDIYRLSPNAEQAKTFHLPAEADLDNLTMHAGFTVLGVKIECADAFTGDPKPSAQISLMIDIDSEDEEANSAAEDFYQRIQDSEEVEITMPYEAQFWGGKMGSFTDKYGISWMLHSSPWSQAVDHPEEHK
ncbi:VOC family protein [Companilactobacillus mishanensis]|uniref:Glyoxalase/bleomycin resistance/extradiol dioxygenase family protein n=1 Tax=Companilactobacillus mishanensis TaxID=2486008 RepID=A0A5P0ZI14_9LACO|nr:glyoxalase/bleomycin resistance/extradiol dioxygenase family protein [Companilactobacillus mishanensis]MQS45194.1 glyoxalase/bleomycin resistance/extradiol dioxygenase family protein [Companilactobacillus mishanensis]MQS52711.1 glyoxalase/bleomycin resistance/extradiol dioxygenase family protein [Companilactobacillus mishanensis]